MMKNYQLQPIFLLILLGLLWSSGYSLARFVEIRGNVTPLGYMFWQTIGPTILLLCYLLITRVSLKKFFRHWRYYTVTGVLGVVIPNTNMYFITAHVPSNLVAILINISPLIIYPFALLFQLEKFDWKRLCFVVMGVVGIFLIILSKTSVSTHELTPWFLLALLTPFNFAICTIYITKYRPEDSNSVMLSAGMMLMASIILTPIVLCSHQFYAMNHLFNLTNEIVLLRIVLSGIGYVVLFRLLKIAGPVYYSLVDGVVILLGLFWGWLIFGERLNAWSIPAALLIVTAVILMGTSNRGFLRKKS